MKISLLSPEVSVGDYNCELIFESFPQQMVIYPVGEHIVEAINEAFCPSIVSADDLNLVNTITINNIEAINGRTYNNK